MIHNTLSIIVSTYNGAKKLSGIMQRLIDLQGQYDELIIVVDGSTDNTLELLDSYRAYNPKLKVIAQKNMGRSMVRNNGAMAATGDLLLFFDDDMLPEADCIGIHKRHHQTHFDSLLTGGLSEFVGTEYVEIQKYRVWLREIWNKELKEKVLIQCDYSNLGLSAANFSVSRKLFLELKMFDNKLNDGEDFDLAYRAYKKGAGVYINYKAFAWHNDAISFKRYVKRVREYAKGILILQTINPEEYEHIFKKRMCNLKSFKRYFYALFSFEGWITMVDKGVFTFLPHTIRYKLYEIILQANTVYFPDKVRL